MKKFITTLFILLVLAGAVFFLGWVQLSVPPGAYGVIRSRTHNADPLPVHSGEFRWLWYKLIPRNVEISVFRLDPLSRMVNIQNTLPSGRTYAAFAGTKADFSWELKGSLSFQVNPGSLVSLVNENNLASQEALDTLQRQTAEKIEGLILVRLSSADMGADELEEMVKTGRNSALENDIYSRFPWITDFSFTMTSSRLPDFALYNELRTLYGDYVARQREYLSPSIEQKALDNVDTQVRFAELEQYGALLEKYPVLLEYLALEKGIWNDSGKK